MKTTLFSTIDGLSTQIEPVKPDVTPRADVAAALTALEAGLRPALFRSPEMYESAMAALAVTREQLGLPVPADQ